MENQPQVVTATPKFNTHKVFAAIGIILTVTILILAALSWYFWDEIFDTVEEEQVTTKVSTTSATTATNSATTSAN